jgi:hypothetical protein
MSTELCQKWTVSAVRSSFTVVSAGWFDIFFQKPFSCINLSVINNINSGGQR